MVQRITYKIGDDELILETGRLAKQANGSIYAQYAGTAIIATVCASSDSQEGLDYVPLTLEYNEKYYAAGKIPADSSSEGRPKDKEILVSASSTAPCGRCSKNPSDGTSDCSHLHFFRHDEPSRHPRSYREPRGCYLGHSVQRPDRGSPYCLDRRSVRR